MYKKQLTMPANFSSSVLPAVNFEKTLPAFSTSSGGNDLASTLFRSCTSCSVKSSSELSFESLFTSLWAFFSDRGKRYDKDTCNKQKIANNINQFRDIAPRLDFWEWCVIIKCIMQTDVCQFVWRCFYGNPNYLEFAIELSGFQWTYDPFDTKGIIFVSLSLSHLRQCESQNHGYACMWVKNKQNFETMGKIYIIVWLHIFGCTD